MRLGRQRDITEAEAWQPNRDAASVVYVDDPMRYLLISALAGLLAGQPSPHFEVASIRASADPVPGQTGAGVQITQSQVRVSGLPLRTYLSIAYRLQGHQVIG